VARPRRRLARVERTRKAGLGGTQPSCWARERLTGATALATHLAETGALAPGLTVERARDLIWLHTAPDIYRLLVLERGWTLDDYQLWFATSLATALLAQAGPSGTP
jgi:hypothetical protein